MSPRPSPRSDVTSREIDEAVKQLFEQAPERAKAILRRNRVQLDAGAELLLPRETLEADDLPRLVLGKAA